MQTNLLKHIVEKLAGQGAVPIVEILESKKDVNEFLIAKKMDLTINQVRNILYKLSAEGLVSFIRKKDKRKGWYIYFWTLNTQKCLVKVEAELKQEIEELKELLRSRETKRFYNCKTCNIEINEEKALEHDFACEECADLYELSDNSEIIKDLTNKISRKEKILASVEEERSKVDETETKKRVAKQKKKDEEIQAERKKKRLQKKKEKDDMNNKTKKIIKKTNKKIPAKKAKKVIKKNKKRK